LFDNGAECRADCASQGALSNREYEGYKNGYEGQDCTVFSDALSRFVVYKAANQFLTSLFPVFTFAQELLIQYGRHLAIGL
jgi:hypothetical protein